MDFVRRHKKKLIALGIAGVVGGAIAYTAYNVRKKFKEFEELLPPPPPPPDEDHMSVLRMQIHLQTAISDSERSVRTHVGQLLKRVTALTEEVEEITNKLQHEKPSKKEKVKLWQDLKVSSFVRLVTSAVGLCALHLMVHVQLTILSRQTLRQSLSLAQGPLECLGGFQKAQPITESTKIKTLMLLSHFNDAGLTYLRDQVARAVQCVVDRSLSGEMNANDLEDILSSITRVLFTGTAENPESVLDLSKVLLPPKISGEGTDPVFENLAKEIGDIIRSPAFSQVLSASVQSVTDHIVAATFEGQSLTAIADSTQPEDATSPPTISGEPNSNPIPTTPSPPPKSPSPTLSAAVPLSESQISTASDTNTTGGGGVSNLKPKVILRLQTIVKLILHQDTDLVGQLSSLSRVKGLCSIIFTAQPSHSAVPT